MTDDDQENAFYLVKNAIFRQRHRYPASDLHRLSSVNEKRRKVRFATPVMCADDHHHYWIGESRGENQQALHWYRCISPEERKKVRQPENQAQELRK